MIEKITVMRDYIEINTRLLMVFTEDDCGKLIFDYAEIITECKGKVRLTSDDIKSLKRILNSKELDLRCI